MGFLNSLKTWLKSEAAEAKATVSDVGSKLDSDLSRREREMNMTPEEKIENIQNQVDDDPFAAARDKIEGTQAGAMAEEELMAEAKAQAEAEVAQADAAEAVSAQAAKDLRSAEETLTGANEAARAEEILKSLRDDVAGQD